MKRIALVGTFLLAALAVGWAPIAKPQGQSDKVHKVVMHVPVNAPDTLNQALNNIGMLNKLYGLDNVQIELVVNGQGLDLFLKESPYAPRLQSLYVNGNLKFGICAATMDFRKLTKADLIQEDYAQKSIVQGGLTRVIELQEAGYSYIRN